MALWRGKNIENYLRSYGKYIIRQAKRVLKKKNASGNLSNSLNFKLYIGKDGRYSLMFYQAEYGKYVSKGVSGTKKTRSYISTRGKRLRSPYKYTTKMPPPSKLDKWIIRKGIAPRDKAGKFMSRKSLQFLIARSIQAKGLKATSHYSQPISMSRQLLIKDLKIEFGKDIIKQIKIR